MTAEAMGPRSALDHLQLAASEMIAAARAALDTLDSVVAEPPGPAAILGRIGPLAEWLFDWVGAAAGATGRDRTAGGSDGGRPDPPSGPSRAPQERKPVEHIPVR